MTNELRTPWRVVPHTQEYVDIHDAEGGYVARVKGATRGQAIVDAINPREAQSATGATRDAVQALLTFVENGQRTNSRDISDWRSDLDSVADMLRVWLAAPAAAQPAGEAPCRHEWFEGKCVHCEITPSQYRAAQPAGAQEPVARFMGLRGTPHGTREFWGYLNEGVELPNGSHLYAAPTPPAPPAGEQEPVYLEGFKTARGEKAVHLEDGIWQRVQNPFLHGCCDCGLCHRMHYRVVDDELEIKVFRNEAETESLRKALNVAAPQSAPMEEGRSAANNPYRDFVGKLLFVYCEHWGNRHRRRRHRDLAARIRSCTQGQSFRAVQRGYLRLRRNGRFSVGLQPSDTRCGARRSRSTRPRFAR